MIDVVVTRAADWLLERNVDAVYVDDLIDVLETHWSANVTEKTHAFWSHRQFLERLQHELGDGGVTVTEIVNTIQAVSAMNVGMIR